MGIKRVLNHKKVQNLFANYTISKITPTTNGIVDTTYILTTPTNEYILKYYERDIHSKIDEDAQRLQQLNAMGLHVPILVDKAQGYYLYTKLKGVHPHAVHSYHIVALARFLATMHTLSKDRSSPKPSSTFIKNYDLQQILTYTKKHFYYYFSKLKHNHIIHHNDGFIHGDIFKDNTLFEKNTIAVFDFIDGGMGSFCFDCGVALMAFTPKTRQKYNMNLFLKVYNQHAPKKLSYKELASCMKEAKRLYALLRINHYHTTSRAKELVF